MRKQDAPEGSSVSQHHHSEAPDDNILQRHRLRTVALINLAGMMERMDEQARLLHNLSYAQTVCVQGPSGVSRVLVHLKLIAGQLLCRFCLLSTMLWAKPLMPPLQLWAT